MVTGDDAIVVISEALRRYAGDQRMKNLFIWGAHTDCRAEPCECCGTPIAVLEIVIAGAFPATEWNWVEIIDEHGRKTLGYWGPLSDLMFIPHTPERCRSHERRE